MSFYDDIGSLALGTRVRLLSEIITRDATMIYQAYDNKLNPKWFPVFYVLSKREENSVTSIAECIGHTHASISKIVSEMVKAGLVSEKSDKNDRRRTQLLLTKKGLKIALQMESQYQDVSAAVEEIASQAKHNLWAAIGEWESLLEKKSLYDRVLEKRKSRESYER